MTELSKELFPRTWKTLEEGLAEGVAPGFVVGVWRDREPDLFRISAWGRRRIEPSGLPMLSDTVFDLASVSKVFATATLAATLVERGWLDWSTRVAAIFPSYPNGKIEIRHLLSHTAGFPAWDPLWEKMRDRFAPRAIWEVSISDRQKAMRELVFAIRPTSGAGEKAEYSDISFLLLGFVLEEVAQMPLDRAVREMVWNRMEIRGAYYRHTNRSPVEVDERVAATELSPWHETVLQGQVHDENCWAMGGYGGHAGVFARAEDLLRFSKALFHGFLTVKTLRAMWTRVSEPTGCTRTLGWDTPSGEIPSAGKFFSPNSVGHLGFAGPSLWIDPDARLAVALMSNRVHLTRENIKIRAFRPRFHDAIRLDLQALPD